MGLLRRLRADRATTGAGRRGGALGISIRQKDRNARKQLLGDWRLNPRGLIFDQLTIDHRIYTALSLLMPKGHARRSGDISLIYSCVIATTL